MKLAILDPDTFLNDFLSPLSRVSDGGTLSFKDGKISSLAATSDNTIIIYGEYNTQTPEKHLNLNVPDLKKLHRLISLISGPIELEIDRNSISYTSETTRFKYHLYEDGVLSMPALNMSKLAKIDFNCKFTIHSSKLDTLIRGSILTPDVKKVYISSSDNKVYAELTDKNRHNVDNYATLLSEDYKGSATLNSIPLTMEVMRMINSSKIEEFNVKFASAISVFNFELKTPTININYITSALAN